MTKTGRINLYITPPSEDNKRFRDFRNEIAGDGDDTNMVIIDREIGRILDSVIFSETQPTPDVQRDGDVWNEIIA